MGSASERARTPPACCSWQAPPGFPGIPPRCSPPHRAGALPSSGRSPAAPGRGGRGLCRRPRSEVRCCRRPPSRWRRPGGRPAAPAAGNPAPAVCPPAAPGRWGFRSAPAPRGDRPAVRAPESGPARFARRAGRLCPPRSPDPRSPDAAAFPPGAAAGSPRGSPARPCPAPCGCSAHRPGEWRKSTAPSQTRKSPPASVDVDDLLGQLQRLDAGTGEALALLGE